MRVQKTALQVCVMRIKTLPVLKTKTHKTKCVNYASKKNVKNALKNENVLVWKEGENIAIMRLERRKRLSSYGRRKRVSNNTFSTKKYS